MKNLKKLAGIFLCCAFGMTSCQDPNGTDSLSVAPSTPIVFAASGNSDVTLTVTTDADDWAYTAPEWVSATRDGDVLVVNTKADNTSEDALLGRITFTAGSAKAVNVSVMQEGINGGGPVDPNAISAALLDVSGSNDVKVEIAKELTVSAGLKLTLSKASSKDVEIRVSVDESYITQYDYAHKTSSTLLPAEIYTLSDGSTKLTVSAGETEVVLPFTFNGDALPFGTQYLLPLKAEVVSGDAAFFKNSDARLNYAVIRKSPRASKQLCVMEFNDTNPLNVLTYKLEDGSYFFDALVLFSGNIGWYPEEDRVAFNKRYGETAINANTAALISEPEKYLKPIHDAGIKVYMGLMPHHTYAGLTNISNWGCEQFAIEMAEIAKDCYIDGFFLDEEYTGNHGGAMSSKWMRTSADNTYGNGVSMMAYQLWKQASAVCDWPIDISYFQYGISFGKVTDPEDNSEHRVSEFCNCVMANYGGSGSPRDDQTLADCCGVSIECARGYGSSASAIKAKMDEGYGWGAAWFAWDPTTSRALKSLISQTAELCYGSKLVEPTVYYKKIGEGQYDDTPYEY